jgi:F0F1-type ATP synthase epsilon subunit
VALHVEIVSPERVLYSGDGDMVVARAADGDIAFLPGHAPFIGALSIAPVRVLLEQQRCRSRRCACCSSSTVSRRPRCTVASSRSSTTT